jgi:hypothetical protein
MGFAVLQEERRRKTMAAMKSRSARSAFSLRAGRGIDNTIRMRNAELQGTGKDRADCMKKFRAASDRFSSDPARLIEFLEMRKRLRRVGPAPSTNRSRCPAVASSSRTRKPGHGFSQLYSAGIALVSGRSTHPVAASA